MEYEERVMMRINADNAVPERRHQQLIGFPPAILRLTGREDKGRGPSRGVMTGENLFGNGDVKDV